MTGNSGESRRRSESMALFDYDATSDCPPEVLDVLDEEECRELAVSVDITAMMVALDCSNEDISAMMDALVKLFDAGAGSYTHTCDNGAKIKVEVFNGQVDVETEPEVDLE